MFSIGSTRVEEFKKHRIEEICRDILKRGESTQYDSAYDSLYELVASEILLEGNV